MDGEDEEKLIFKTPHTGTRRAGRREPRSMTSSPASSAGSILDRLGAALDRRSEKPPGQGGRASAAEALAETLKMPIAVQGLQASHSPSPPPEPETPPVSARSRDDTRHEENTASRPGARDVSPDKFLPLERQASSDPSPSPTKSKRAQQSKSIHARMLEASQPGSQESMTMTAEHIESTIAGALAVLGQFDQHAHPDNSTSPGNLAAQVSPSGDPLLRSRRRDLLPDLSLSLSPDDNNTLSEITAGVVPVDGHIDGVPALSGEKGTEADGNDAKEDGENDRAHEEEEYNDKTQTVVLDELTMEMLVMAEIPAVQHLVVKGCGRKYMACLLTLKVQHGLGGRLAQDALEFARLHGSNASTVEEARNCSAFHQAMLLGFAECNRKAWENSKRLGKITADCRPAQLRRYTVLPDQFSYEERTLCRDGSVDRERVLELFSEVIDSMYGAATTGTADPVSVTPVHSFLGGGRIETSFVDGSAWSPHAARSSYVAPSADMRKMPWPLSHVNSNYNESESTQSTLDARGWTPASSTGVDADLKIQADTSRAQNPEALPVPPGNEGAAQVKTHARDFDDQLLTPTKSLLEIERAVTSSGSYVLAQEPKPSAVARVCSYMKTFLPCLGPHSQVLDDDILNPQHTVVKRAEPGRRTPSKGPKRKSLFDVKTAGKDVMEENDDAKIIESGIFHSSSAGQSQTDPASHGSPGNVQMSMTASRFAPPLPTMYDNLDSPPAPPLLNTTPALLSGDESCGTNVPPNGHSVPPEAYHIPPHGSGIALETRSGHAHSDVESGFRSTHMQPSSKITQRAASPAPTGRMERYSLQPKYSSPPSIYSTTSQQSIQWNARAAAHGYTNMHLPSHAQSTSPYVRVSQARSPHASPYETNAYPRTPSHYSHHVSPHGHNQWHPQDQYEMHQQRFQNHAHASAYNMHQLPAIQGMDF